MKLENKIAVVTGAASGIGRGIALRLAQDGCKVVVMDVNMEKAASVVDEIQAMGRQAEAVKADVTRSQEANQMVRTVLEKFEGLDILVNNAGGHARERQSMFYDSTEEVWDHVIGINLKGTMICCRAVIEHMMEKKNGKIVNISSMAGVTGSHLGVADYAAAKGGVIGFTKALAKEVGPYGINVNSIAPGIIATERVLAAPEETKEQWRKSSFLNRLGEPEDIAATVSFLVSEDASFISGQNILVCGARP
ncbi:SDR family NAD(P)-dependent oxidoreductase [Chloroflexota bacterium]